MFFAVISTLLSVLIPSGFLYRWKWFISYIYIRINGLLTKKRFDYLDFEARNEPEKSGFLAPQLEFDLESPEAESHLLKAQDKVLCYGVSSKSETVVVSVARLCEEKAEACVYLKLANGKTYRLKETSDYQQPTSEQRVFSCGGLQMHYECPMRRWRVFYSGFLCESSEGNLETERMVYVKFAFLWRASSNVFDLMTDISPRQLAGGFARAKWKQPIPPLNK
ncbi:uncharacterized protein LOC129234324 [Uloborus diversus]|uniref:uncharacterized protein LOC129234324 n=1 Tax=Uloborus diversus TaxID=327109 RepID=UPI00240A995F|nr:uncharacterized protein LOC129234324 [Uloborus diversus]